MDFDRENLNKAILEWRASIGESGVINDGEEIKKYGQNEIAVNRKIPAVLRPKVVEEIVAVVKIANKYKIPIYTISTGNNWGYGGSSPVVDNCVVLDLSQMNKIVEMDEELGLVTLQPGVTPKKLRDYLDSRNLPYLVPVSGAGPFCSILGNALERGYGVTPYVDHFGAVTSLEAVLPNGEIYRSALSAMGGKTVDRIFKWGIGPYLDGIFTQGNFGIVTEMTIALAPIPENTVGFLFGLKSDSYLEETVCAVRDILKTIGNITGSINVMNAHRVLSMVENYPFDKVKKGEIISQAAVDELLKKNYLGSWTVGGIIYGERKLVNSAKSIIKKKVGSFARRLFFFSRSRINFLRGVLNFIPDVISKNLKKQLNNLDESFKVAEGAPTEIALPLCYWKSGVRPPKGQMMNPAQDGCGVIWYSPLVPMKPDRVRVYVDMIKKICSVHRIEPLITLTSFSHRCFDSTVPILFDPKDSDETFRAKKCYSSLYEAGKKEGFLPYRMGIDHMELVTKTDSSYWNLVSKLKDAIDPHNIFSPGRYCPLDKLKNKK